MASMLRNAWTLSGRTLSQCCTRQSLLSGPRNSNINISKETTIQMITIKRTLSILTKSPINVHLYLRQGSKVIKVPGTLSPCAQWIVNGQQRVLLSQMSYRNPMDKNKSVMLIVCAVIMMVLGASYAAVPLYRIYCQKTKTGGQAVQDEDVLDKVATMKKVADRKISVIFEADKSSRLAWDFKPSQGAISCTPGETVLAFYTAINQLDRPVNGIATYTILPYEAGQYFNKIQCFCFEEQQLNPNELVDLPVFFYIDPEFAKDPALFDTEEIILSYNFFETKSGFKLARPPPVRAHLPPTNIGKGKSLTESG